MESFLESLPTYVTILVTICGGVTIALYAGMAIWAFRDIRSRSRDVLAQILATLLVLVLPVVGLVVYILLRPKETLEEAYERSLEQEALLQAIEEPEHCRRCGHRVKGEYLFCPNCHTQVKAACAGCGRPLQTHWKMCPYCGTATGVVSPPTAVTEQAAAEPSGVPTG
jgi:RNA polymerase subunit RPABC4/transcription elongation factor Spt4